MINRRTIIAAMAGYYVITGAWPIVHMRSFEAVTGRKKDRWLVHMVGALALANGIALGVGVTRREAGLETYTLAIGSIVAFSAIDIAYVFRKTIAPIYLGDAVLEMLFATALCLGSSAMGDS